MYYKLNNTTMSTMTSVMPLRHTKLRDAKFNTYVVLETSTNLMRLMVNYTKEERLMKLNDIPEDFRVEYESPLTIKKYCNFHGYSDVEPYEVVKVISDVTVEIRSMDYKLVQAPTCIPGGFVGHTFNHEQRWECISNPENPTQRIRWSESKRGWGLNKYHMSDEPIKFYDYNF